MSLYSSFAINIVKRSEYFSCNSYYKIHFFRARITKKTGQVRAVSEMRRAFPGYKRAEMDECGFRDYHKETMREMRAKRRERERERNERALVWALLLLTGSSFSAPEPIQVDERRFSFSPPICPPVRPLASDFPRRFPAARSPEWNVGGRAMCNVMQPPVCIIVGNSRGTTVHRCSREIGVFENFKMSKSTSPPDTFNISHN